MSGPYKNHSKLTDHPVTREAIGDATIFPADIVETCSVCGQRWLESLRMPSWYHKPLSVIDPKTGKVLE